MTTTTTTTTTHNNNNNNNNTTTTTTTTSHEIQYNDTVAEGGRPRLGSPRAARQTPRSRSKPVAGVRRPRKQPQATTELLRQGQNTTRLTLQTSNG